MEKGDVLIVNMSDKNLKTGATNPYEIEIFLKKEVKIFSCSNLHAKVFIFDNTLIVGSSNVSQNSKNKLLEAAIVTKNKKSIIKANTWIKSLQLQEISPEQIEHGKRIYKPPIKEKKSQRNAQPQLPELWILSTREYDPSEKEKNILEAIEKRVSKKTDSTKYEIESIRWNGKSRIIKRIRNGHFIVQIHKESEDRILVYPPSFLVNIKHYSNDKGTKKVYLTIETPTDLKPISWNEFKNVTNITGLKGITVNSVRSIKSSDAKKTIWNFWMR